MFLVLTDIDGRFLVGESVALSVSGWVVRKDAVVKRAAGNWVEIGGEDSDSFGPGSIILGLATMTRAVIGMIGKEWKNENRTTEEV